MTKNHLFLLINNSLPGYFVLKKYPGKKNMKGFLSFIMLVALASCIQEIEYEIDAVPKQLVVNAVVQEGQYVKVNVSALQSIFDSTYHFIADAVVCVQFNGDRDTLINLGDGNYRSHTIAKQGDAIALSVTKEGYDRVYAADTVPLRTEILKAKRIKTNETGAYGDPVYEYAITFKCNEQAQLYEFFIAEQVMTKDGRYGVGFSSYDIEVDPIISQSGIKGLNSYFFSSESIAGSIYTLTMKMRGAWSPGGSFITPLFPAGETKTAVVLRTISQSYVDYRISSEKHLLLKNDSSIVEDLILVPLIGPQPEIYSNIENGQGILASFCQSYFFID